LDLARQAASLAKSLGHLLFVPFNPRTFVEASLVATKVPGPREPLFIHGKRLRDVMFWVPHSVGLGLGLSILSYAGKVIVGVRVDEAVTKNPHRLVELFEEEASSLLQADGSS
jgi:hypothetical protein